MLLFSSFPKGTFFRIPFISSRCYCSTTTKPEVKDDVSFYKLSQARDGSLAPITGTSYEGAVALALEADGHVVVQQKKSDESTNAKSRIDITLINKANVQIEVKTRHPYSYGETTLRYKEGEGYVLNKQAVRKPQNVIFARLLASNLHRVDLTNMSQIVRDQDPHLFGSYRLNNNIYNGAPLPKLLKSEWVEIRKVNPLYTDHYYLLPDWEDVDGLYGSDLICEYYRIQGCSYIQIEGKGVYRLGKDDPLNIGATRFDPSSNLKVYPYVRVRIRIKESFSGGVASVQPTVHMSINLKTTDLLEPSNYCLVHKREKSLLWNRDRIKIEADETVVDETVVDETEADETDV